MWRKVSSRFCTVKSWLCFKTCLSEHAILYRIWTFLGILFQTKQEPGFWGFLKGTAAPYSVFVEEVEDHVGQTRVAPVSMNQEELLQVLKARKSEIAGHHRLHTQWENINQRDTHAHTRTCHKHHEAWKILIVVHVIQLIRLSCHLQH